MPTVTTEANKYKSPNDFSDAEIIALSGLLGIHDNINDPKIKLEIDIKRGADYIRVTITSIEIKELLIVIYPGNKIIRNESFVKDSIRTGLGFKWVKTQVTFATIFPFKRLEGSAHRNDSDTKIKWTGYFIWPKFGYLMDEEDEKSLTRKLKRDQRTEESLSDLYLTDNGIKYWIQNGDTWDCYFDLKQNSVSRMILRRCRPSGDIHSN